MMKVKRMTDHIIAIKILWCIQALILFILAIVNIFIHSVVIMCIIYIGEFFIISNIFTLMFVDHHNNKILNDVIKKYREENNRLIKEVFGDKNV